jgi:DNA polymerase-3 subunit beta
MGVSIMKFTMKKELLLEGLNKVSKVVPHKPSMPILGGIYVRCTSQEMLFMGTDATESIIHSIVIGEDCTIEQEGAAVLPKNIVDIAKKLNKDVHVELDGFQATIRSGKAEFQLNCFDPEEYPRIPMTFDSPLLTMKGTEFLDLVNRTAFCVSTSEVRPILQGVQLVFCQDQIHAVATDSHRLGNVRLKGIKSEKEVTFIIPGKTLDNVSKVLNAALDIEIFGTGTNISFRSGNTVYISRLLDGNYPDTTRLIPTEYTSVVNVDRKALIEGLELVNGITDKAAACKMHVNGAIHLSSFASQTGKAQTEIEYGSLEGEKDYELAFSIRYVIEALRSMSAERVDFCYTGAARPFILRPAEDCRNEQVDELQLILPVRTQ